MNRLTKTLFVAVVVSMQLLSVVPSFAQQQMSLKRKVAVGRFSNETVYAKSIFYDKDNDPIGKQAADILMTKLGASEKFLLIERQDYDKIVAEMATSGNAPQGIGADYLIIGSVTEFGRKTVGQEKIFSSGKQQIVEAGVSIRLVDVATGLVIYSGEAKGEATTEDRQVLGLGKTADYDATLADKAISAAITKLVENIINKCMDNPWKAYILAVEDDFYVVSGGKSQGISEGNKFSILQRGRKVKNPQTGLMIELLGKEVGKIKISQTLGDTPESEISLATIIEGSIDINALDNYYITEIK